MATIEQLTQQIADLQLIVKKQSQLLTKTGQQVLTLQVQSQRERVDAFDPKLTKPPSGSARSSVISKIDTTDFVTNEDIVQLVGELQGQLEIVEERSIRRLINSQKKDDETLAPILNHDGEEPDVELYPKDIITFTKINDEDLVQLARFYELLPPTAEERANFDDFVEGKTAKLDESIKVDPSNYSKDDLVEAFDNVAKVLGLKVRRGTDAW